ncbi:MAG: hypothetical protein AB7L92_02010 [Alphaproteobacteria bacterium]
MQDGYNEIEGHLRELNADSITHDANTLRMRIENLIKLRKEGADSRLSAGDSSISATVTTDHLSIAVGCSEDQCFDISVKLGNSHLPDQRALPELRKGKAEFETAEELNAFLTRISTLDRQGALQLDPKKRGHAHD